jgi:16S rRNA (uracil1498-N3)-methyltransferase
MNLFYAPDLNSTLYTLPEDESKHLVRVLRMEPGDIVHLTDGKGTLAEARIVDPSTKHCSVRIIKSVKDYNKRSFHLHIAIAPTKNIDRFEWFLEKSTEIGIDEVTPMICEHSERMRLNPERLRKVLVAAMKQSLKAFLPKLHELVDYKKFISKPFNGEKFIAYCGEEETVELQSIYRKGAKALILIGPEGDFSFDEVEEAKKAGFLPISLGKSRLRTETAGIVACHAINLLNSDTIASLRS